MIEPGLLIQGGPARPPLTPRALPRGLRRRKPKARCSQGPSGSSQITAQNPDAEGPGGHPSRPTRPSPSTGILHMHTTQVSSGTHSAWGPDSSSGKPLGWLAQDGWDHGQAPGRALRAASSGSLGKQTRGAVPLGEAAPYFARCSAPRWSDQRLQLLWVSIFWLVSHVLNWKGSSMNILNIRLNRKCKGDF